MKMKQIIATAMLGIAFTTMVLPFGQIESYAMTVAPNDMPFFEKQEEVSVYAAKTEWKYRTKNGKPQKRLWSNAEHKWLTDWQYV